MHMLKSNQMEQPVAEAVKIAVSLGLRDCLTRALITWRVWGIVLGLALLFAIQSLYFALFPSPQAVSASTVFFLYEIPLLFALAAFLILVVTLAGWFHRL